MKTEEGAPPAQKSDKRRGSTAIEMRVKLRTGGIDRDRGRQAADRRKKRGERSQSGLSFPIAKIVGDASEIRGKRIRRENVI